jgi:hypothetical protein
MDEIRADWTQPLHRGPEIAALDTSIGGVVGLPVVLTAGMSDGDCMLVPAGLSRTLFIGTGPISESTRTRREALRIVRTGLADVLDWLGEKPWRPAMGGHELLDALRNGLVR